ncbi:hypothetical protein [Paenarthrobacter sp. A20]|uniref:hypothetical protein n=1 Tax=Paenarthrobacter sp. A20 TaxID=2817891 RepID=UPI0020A01AE1|nr:hypothetical protein [Paenarthrobacter sp. A20]MCP1414414.1 hypothetical protein [Paenarthrobacter sp. A20]
MQIMHNSIHEEYRQRLANADWALANANAQCKVKDAVIAARDVKIQELTDLLDAATDPAA